MKILDILVSRIIGYNNIKNKTYYWKKIFMFHWQNFK